VGDDRSRLHQIVDELPEDELAVARQLLELLARGRATVAPRPADGASNDDDDEDDDEEEEDQTTASPETIAKLAQLSDEELLRLDELLATDRDAARQFWRDRFGEDLADDELIDNGRS
jgi:hypothetical protein